MLQFSSFAELFMEGCIIAILKVVVTKQGLLQGLSIATFKQNRAHRILKHVGRPPGS